MQIVETIGNNDLMAKEKTLFICSKHTPLNLYKHILQWTDGLTTNDCIACFNTTEMEQEVLKALLVARIPVVLFVINSFTDVNNIQVERALCERRMLIVVLRRDEPIREGIIPRLRNRYVLSLCKRVVCGYVNKNGSVYSLLAGYNNVKRLINVYMLTEAAEIDSHYERWTVAQDKILLRMFYSDMGIHAIHKRLHRSHTSIYSRIRAITIPEETLKGREFEDFVLSMFISKYGDELVLQEWQGDKSLGTIHPENNSNPDFVFRYREKTFAVECKWRGSLHRNMRKKLFTAGQVEKYRAFEKCRGIQVTIVLGIGGEPCNPEKLYIIPLKDIDKVSNNSIPIANYLSPDFAP
ncbi:MAG: hypothetical protein IJS89_07620 [Bacteroidaceae bacterium]|nr:hypothetical protein [Bacteroidaceae bacterium]